MDYTGEQEMELEALEAILMDDMQPYDGTVPDGWKSAGQMYKIKIDPATEGDEDDADVEYDKSMELIFSHTASYPETAPNFKLRSVQGLSDADIAAGQAVLRQVVEENLGMAMIYTLVGAAKEWLRGKLSGAANMDDDPELEEKKRRDAEEAHRAALRAQGTPVTAETFAAWKARFDAEMAALKAKAAESLKDDDKAKRLTGKAYFQRLAADQMGDDEADALSADDEEIFDDDASTATGTASAGTRPTTGAAAAGEEDDDDDDDDDEDFDYEDDEDEDDEELLEQILAAKR